MRVFADIDASTGVSTRAKNAGYVGNSQNGPTQSRSFKVTFGSIAYRGYRGLESRCWTAGVPYPTILDPALGIAFYRRVRRPMVRATTDTDGDLSGSPPLKHGKNCSSSKAFRKELICPNQNIQFRKVMRRAVGGLFVRWPCHPTLRRRNRANR